MPLSTLMRSPRVRVLLVALSIVLMSSVAFFFKTPVPRPSLWSGVSDVKEVVDMAKDTPPTLAPVVQPEPGEVVMVTASTGTNGFLGIPGLKEMIYENRMSYAHRWGYEFMWANITSYNFGGAKVVWNKIPIMQDAFARFPKAKWIWWLDIDIIIMTPSLDLHTLVLSPQGMMRSLMVDKRLPGVGGGYLGFNSLPKVEPDQINFILAIDNWGMNLGSFLMRRGIWTDWVLELWADPLATAKDWTFQENDGWTHIFKAHKVVRDHTGLTHQRALNSYPAYNALGQHWQKGDLVVHFAGCGNHTKCPEHWNVMWQQRENYTVPDFVQEELADGAAKIEWVQKGVPL